MNDPACGCAYNGRPRKVDSLSVRSTVSCVVATRGHSSLDRRVRCAHNVCAQCALSRVGTKVSGLLIVCVGAHTFHVSSRVKMALESDEYITHDGELDRTVPIGGRLPVISLSLVDPVDLYTFAALQEFIDRHGRDAAVRRRDHYLLVWGVADVADRVDPIDQLT